MNLLNVSGSPHLHGDLTIKKIMWGVVYAMIPALLVSIYFFGLGAIKVVITSVIACLFFEWIITKYLLKQEPQLSDGSAVITGILLAFNVPSNLPIWIIIVGALVAIGIGKMSFGGLGKNPFNPALVGRVFLLISFPVQLTSWPVPKPIIESIGIDAITGPTPLGIVKEGLKAGQSMESVMSQVPDYVQLLIGHNGGSLGEVSALALLIGGLYMLYRKIITWHIPFSYMASVLIFSGILWLINPELYVNPLFHLVTGGMMLGIFFMATDMVSSPMTPAGQILFGVGVGVLTIIIRVWAAYPEGVSFAILIMNAATPLLNMIKPKRFGEIIKS